MFVSLSLLLAIATVLADEAAESPQPKPLHEHPTIVAMWKHNNAWRAAVDLPPMTLSPELTKAAQDQAWFMAKNEEMSHETNGGLKARVDKTGYKPQSLAENIAHNQRSVADVFERWKDSPGHWANIAGKNTEIGCGYAVSAKGEPYWVLVFGTPLPPPPEDAPPAPADDAAGR